MDIFLWKGKATNFIMSIINYFLVLGCGHSESLDHFNNNSIVIASDGNLLIDCGHTIKHALAKQQMSIEDVDAIYISHVHGDHVFGLERFAYESKFKYKKRIKLIFHRDLQSELWDQTLKGSLGRHGDGDASLSDYFDVVVLDEYNFSIFGNDYELIPVRHTPGKPTYGLLINKYLFFSADTIALPKLMSVLDFAVGFHDVTLSHSNPVHATLDSLVSLYPAMIKKKLYLMSYEDSWREYIVKVDSEFLGFASQGMIIELKHGKI